MKKSTLLLVSWLVAGMLSAMTVQAGDTIRIGTTQSLTGVYKEFGTAQLEGMQMWVHDINARGALLGKTVELVHYDDHSDTERSVWLYRKLINEDKVDLLIGPYGSDLTLAASTVAEESSFPMVASAASAEQIWQRGYKNIFGTDTPSANYMDLAVEVAAKKGAKTAGLIYSNTEFSSDVAAGVRREVAKHGMKLVLDEEYDLNQTDFSALATKLRSVQADVLFGATYLEDSVHLSKALQAGGSSTLKVDMVVLTVGPSLPEFADLMGPRRGNGIVGVVQWLRSVRLPMAQDFAYRYRQKYGANPGVHAAIGYSAGQVLEAAVRLAGSTDKDALRAQLSSLEFSSLLGLYQVDATGRQVGKQNYLLQWQDGERKLVAPASLAERELIYPLF